MPHQDPLLTGIDIALPKALKRGRSAKTRYNRIKEATRFVKVLRELGYGAKKWDNITNKHVGAVVDVWKEQNLTPATIKGNMSAIRTVARYFGNDRIHEDNAAFDIGNRIYITNLDRSLPDDVFENTVKTLKLGEKEYDTRIAAMLLLERYLGLRTEEAAKFNPYQADMGDRVFVCHGTKGGRERFIQEITVKGRNAIDYTKRIAPGKRDNLIPDEEGMTERKWITHYYNRIRALGMSKRSSGASGHGNRHAYAQERYESMTGFPAPCKFTNLSEFVENAVSIAGDEWETLDRHARTVLKAELGHGPQRDDVVSQYLGSTAREWDHSEDAGTEETGEETV
jgi:site-specific recombinase XerD